MKLLKSLSHKKPAKDDRERLILLGLVELYLETGEPIGSNTLKDHGFGSLSSATLRNYFVKLEKAGYLKQQHTSGGRIPTSLGLKVYADSCLENHEVESEHQKILQTHLLKESKEVASYLQSAAEIVSELSGCAVFLSSPRFDQDFILSVKLLEIDSSRCLCVLITDFGLVHTEILYLNTPLEEASLKRIESYLNAKVGGRPLPLLNEEEERLSHRFYKEVMLRHIVDYTHFSAEDLYKTGVSKLLGYKDFQDPEKLALCLGLFENEGELRKLLAKSTRSGGVSFWIGEDLKMLSSEKAACSILATSYKINQTSVGSLAILGPERMPYRTLFSILKTASDLMSSSLTRSLYKFKITYRQPSRSLDQTSLLLLEDQTKEIT